MNQLGFDYFEVSAKLGTGVKEFFRYMAYRIGGGKKSSISTIENVQTQKPKGATLVNPAI